MSRTSSNLSARPSNGLPPPSHSRDGAGERAVPVPAVGGFFSGADRNGGIIPAPTMYELARSPPSGPNKNTKHVPCKFFRQGACQAGTACPFSHSLDPTTHQAPCKYFMKGNCKFGAKCALAHYLPDGRRVNRSDLEAGMAMGGVSFGRQQNRPEPVPFPNLDPQQQFPNDFYPSQNPPFPDSDEVDAFQDRYNQFQSNPPYDSAFNSPPLSQFGSPPNETILPRSPAENARTALNAPLPQSFDSNGVSHIAKYGPLGQSVPDKFGMRSPASSSLSRQIGSPPETGPFRSSQLGSNLRGASPLAASPQNNDESIGQRIMHSQKTSKPRMISASVPRSSLHPDWQDPLDAEADLLPNSLHEDILTPQEKFRRLSRPDQEGVTIPSGTSSKVGSPPAAGSPSRFSHLWAEQREKKAAENNGSTFGHVGSPLQQSWMPVESSSVPRNSQVSGISQAMARMQLNKTESNESGGGRPSTLRQSSNPITRIDRTISSPGLSAKRIDEEGEVFFQMDDDTRYLGSSPRLAPLREKTNGELSRQLSKGDEGANRTAKSLYGFRP